MHRLLTTRADDPEVAALLTLGLHHEQQHQELLLTDIKHALSFNPTHAPYARRWPMTSVQAQPLRWFEMAGGLIEHGHDAALDGAFCFDNETPRHRAYTAPFEIASRPVSYGDYLVFIADAGYRRPELWLSMGWDWVCNGAPRTQDGPRTAPLYWQLRDDCWMNHTLQGQVEIDPRTPVCHLSYFEADAFARWAGARLPTEPEWEDFASSADPQLGNQLDQPGAVAPSAGGGVFGDVWEWTQSSFASYPGFVPAEGAVGEYNGKFMSGQMVLRGASCATPRGHSRATYRNFFPPSARWQFTGARLARDA
jgi:ergothioneine biosynthesis protein EgtB